MVSNIDMQQDWKISLYLWGHFKLFGKIKRQLKAVKHLNGRVQPKEGSDPLWIYFRLSYIALIRG
jgi:hypothetical protein